MNVSLLLAVLASVSMIGCNAATRLDVDAPAAYRIEVQGRLDKSWTSWFDDMAITSESGDGGTIVTVLSGTVADQVALHGVLARVRDLGLPLLSVQHIEQE